MKNIQYNSGAIDASGALSGGWNLIKDNYWMYLGITVLAWIMVACIPLANIFIFGPVMVGVYYVLLRQMRGEPVEFGMMFKGFEKFVPAMVAGLIQNIPGILMQIFQLTFDVGSRVMMGKGRAGGRGGEPDVGPLMAFLGAYLIVILLFMVFSIVWHMVFMFVLPLMAEHDIGAIDAIKLSASAAFSNIGGLILLLLLEVVLVIAGIVAICIGVFFVMPVIYAVIAVVYRQVFPDTGGNRYQNTPPAPDVYGSTYGQGQ